MRFTRTCFVIGLTLGATALSSSIAHAQQGTPYAYYHTLYKEQHPLTIDRTEFVVSDQGNPQAPDSDIQTILYANNIVFDFLTPIGNGYYRVHLVNSVATDADMVTLVGDLVQNNTNLYVVPTFRSEQNALVIITPEIRVDFSIAADISNRRSLLTTVGLRVVPLPLTLGTPPPPPEDEGNGEGDSEEIATGTCASRTMLPPGVGESVTTVTPVDASEDDLLYSATMISSERNGLAILAQANTLAANPLPFLSNYQRQASSLLPKYLPLTLFNCPT
jgi:hypothetical protein